MFSTPDTTAYFLRSLWAFTSEQCRAAKMPGVDPDWQPFAGGPAGGRVLERRGLKCYLVTMPPPAGITEAFYVALVEVPTDEGTPKLACFTLELGISLDGGVNTVVASWDRGTHANYGPGPDPADPEAFVERVTDMVKERTNG